VKDLGYGGEKPPVLWPDPSLTLRMTKRV